MQSNTINRLDTLDKDRDRLVKELEKAEENLESVRTFLKFKGEFDRDRDEDKMNRYLQARTDCMLLRRKLQDALIESIVARLETFNSSLKSGIKELNEELESLENTIAILQTAERVISILSRILLLVR